MVKSIHIGWWQVLMLDPAKFSTYLFWKQSSWNATMCIVIEIDSEFKLLIWRQND